MKSVSILVEDFPINKKSMLANLSKSYSNLVSYQHCGINEVLTQTANRFYGHETIGTSEVRDHSESILLTRFIFCAANG